MRFTHAWADVVAQNLTLKVSVGFLTITAFTLAMTTAKLALKPPLIIERACFSKIAKAFSGISGTQHPAQEVQSFIKEAISQRFDSDTEVMPGYLSPEEEKFRQQEQKDFSNRGISQKVIVKVIKIDGKIDGKTDGSTVTVDTDRLISVGQIRSAFSFPLILNLATILRTEGNPYGLIITNVTTNAAPQKKDEVK
ncbi:MAG: hypothetical protein HY072_09715 [Deltaproteobacteria bacterium]|nr:hypothetical protein [Deltaproteobacteria bacterium]